MKELLLGTSREAIRSIAKTITEPTRIELKRKYQSGVTLGIFSGYIDNVLVAEEKTIELVWKDNKPNVSCIPEGIYPIGPSIWNKHNMKVLGIEEIEGRSLVKVHPANYASGKHNELRGCIAPVTEHKDLDGDGIIDGTSSVKAFNRIMAKFGKINCNIIIYS